jgi:hypothetical protein
MFHSLNNCQIYLFFSCDAFRLDPNHAHLHSNYEGVNDIWHYICVILLNHYSRQSFSSIKDELLRLRLRSIQKEL